MHDLSTTYLRDSKPGVESGPCARVLHWRQFRAKWFGVVRRDRTPHCDCGAGSGGNYWGSSQRRGPCNQDASPGQHDALN